MGERLPSAADGPAAAAAGEALPPLATRIANVVLGLRRWEGFAPGAAAALDDFAVLRCVLAPCGWHIDDHGCTTRTRRLRLARAEGAADSDDADEDEREHKRARSTTLPAPRVGSRPGQDSLLPPKPCQQMVLNASLPGGGGSGGTGGSGGSPARPDRGGGVRGIGSGIAKSSRRYLLSAARDGGGGGRQPPNGCAPLQVDLKAIAAAAGAKIATLALPADGGDMPPEAVPILDHRLLRKIHYISCQPPLKAVPRYKGRLLAGATAEGSVWMQSLNAAAVAAVASGTLPDAAVRDSRTSMHHRLGPQLVDYSAAAGPTSVSGQNIQMKSGIGLQAARQRRIDMLCVKEDPGVMRWLAEEVKQQSRSPCLYTWCLQL
eukprot:SM000012S25361  [mRNA]  locus=s12:683658:685819:- [translate_table: standard]